MDSRLRLESLVKSYGRKRALDGLSLDVRSGEIFGLLGPNGAGKTTTLKIVAGLVIPDSGTVEVSGIDAMRHPDRAREISAFVPDQPTLYPKLTGREFLRFIARARRLDPASSESRIGFCEELFDMQGWLDARAESYSHGMTQRVALSAAFLAKPDLYVIDEPMVGLDPASAGTFHRMCRAAADSGSAVVLSTHTLPIALRICDRIGIINGGRLASLVETSSIGEEGLEKLFFELTGTAPLDAAGYFAAGSPLPGIG
ncbi:MAG TPA: ABC transporter ATP-binding protein [Candidatus Fermentibacter sp.]|nr:ABC transporter ATP-binding protein [Candidatus Fermentibacter sp.]